MQTNLPTAARHTLALPYAIGTRHSNSEWYYEATSETAHGWQVFQQKSPDGLATGRKSFVDNSGNLCGVEIAERKRNKAIADSAPELLAALVGLLKFMDPCELDDDSRPVLAARAAILKSGGAV